MGRINSHADILADWAELLDAVRRSPDLLPDVAEDIEILARHRLFAVTPRPPA